MWGRFMKAVKAATARTADKLKAALRGVGRLFKGRALPRGTGEYLALAALLALLGTATWAWRSRIAARNAVELPEAPRPALSTYTAVPAPRSTPEPVVWLWPLAGDCVGEYAPDEPEWSETLDQWQTHPALDIAGAPGEAVYACRDGVVADVWSDRLWGNVIVVDHDDGYRSTYAGLNTLRLVTPGDAVAAGDVISSVGASVPCEADLPAHLHFALSKDGEAVDFAALVDRQDNDCEIPEDGL